MEIQTIIVPHTNPGVFISEWLTLGGWWWYHNWGITTWNEDWTNECGNPWLWEGW